MSLATWSLYFFVRDFGHALFYQKIEGGVGTINLKFQEK